ncbi:hypothetical protein SCFA_1390007 [anaerobic digester metagenome]|uniref:Uncharacterized protein n=1 Tax=anaerobic digester metagenome TaxID=1263854 RepID=A0A485LV25_9ZZZZ
MNGPAVSRKALFFFGFYGGYFSHLEKIYKIKVYTYLSTQEMNIIECD